MSIDNQDRTTQPSKVASSKLEAFVGKNSKIDGSLSFTGTVEIDGKVTGEVHSLDRIIIGESAQIDAKIDAVEVLIRGSVCGDIIASKKISLTSTAKVSGNLSGPSIVLEEGAIFDGRCTMTKAKIITDNKNSDKTSEDLKVVPKDTNKLTSTNSDSAEKASTSENEVNLEKESSFNNNSTTQKVIAIK